MEHKEARNKERCPAMIEAGIADPTSQAGIDFCIDECPYDKCIVETRKHYTRSPGKKTRERLIRARIMSAGGLSVKDIASRLGVSVSIVYRYLKRQSSV